MILLDFLWEYDRWDLRRWCCGAPTSVPGDDDDDDDEDDDDDDDDDDDEDESEAEAEVGNIQALTNG